MENQDQDNNKPATDAAKTASQHHSDEAFQNPDPTDDLQLEIETVVPDDHTKGLASQAGQPGQEPSSSGTEAEEPEKSESEAVRLSQEEGSQEEGSTEPEAGSSDREPAASAEQDDAEESDQEPETAAGQASPDTGNEETSKKDESGNGIETVAP